MDFPGRVLSSDTSIVDAIGALGETSEVVERLLRLWQGLPERTPSLVRDLSDHLYTAMRAVSRRAGVIVVQEGETYRVIERAALHADAPG